VQENHEAEPMNALDNSLEYAGKFVVAGKVLYGVSEEHVNRYLFALSFVKDRLYWMLPVERATVQGC